MSSREEFLFDGTSGRNPVGRGNVKRITVELAKGFAMYLGGGLGDLLGGKGSMTKFRWAMVLEDGGTLESLPMSASEFTRTIGGAIPHEVIQSLIDVAGISVIESKTLSLRQLIELARDQTDGRWPDNVRNAIQYMIDTAPPAERRQSENQSGSETNWLTLTTQKSAEALGISTKTLQNSWVKEHPERVKRKKRGWYSVNPEYIQESKRK